MKKIMKIMLLVLLVPVLLFALYVVGNIVFATATKFSPEPLEALSNNKKSTEQSPQNVQLDSTLSLQFLIWNIGYGGLGAEANFFYDGGKMVVSPKDWVEKYNVGIVDFLKNNQADFIMLQEADTAGRRSWDINQKEEIANALPNYNYSFAINYDVRFVPVPYTNPMGRVLGGLLSLSKVKPTLSERIQLPNKDKFPDQLFYLERCLLLQRFPIASSTKELVVINTHFEAYDNGEVKKKQMEFTKKILEQEYAKGNYVVLGGDWNIAPPGVDAFKFAIEQETDYLHINADSNYIPGWKYVYDANRGSNRKNKTAYIAGKTFTTIIDYFLVSPNIKALNVETVDLGFRSSDHNPVRMQVKLK
ncbi:MAG: endonuclease/exonuclease/phosphatase family protein [Chitinophagales bacterium]|nr:endonuclease/exonuclease/phosphatase family protein [Chitinophagales bacterium]